MKKIAVILSFTLPIFCSAQTIHFEDRGAPYFIYIGYTNAVTILPVVGMDVNLLNVSCINCQLEELANGDSEHLNYNIIPDKGYLKAQIQIKDKNNVLLKEEYFQVSRLPTYDIFLGNQRNGESINKENLMLSVGYPSEISLKIALEILSWEVTIGALTFNGKGENFTDEVVSAMKNSEKGQNIIVNCWAKEEKSGISRKLNAEFKSV